MPASGTVRNLVLHALASVGSAPHTFRIVKNGTPTSLTVTLGIGQTDVSDLVNEVSFVAGDTIAFGHTYPGAGVDQDVRGSVDIEFDAGNTSIYGSTGQTFPPDPGYAHALYGSALVTSANSANVQSLVAEDGFLTAIGMRAAASLTGAQQLVACVYKNGTKQDGSGGTVDTRVTMSAGSQNAYGNFSLPVSAGDRVWVEVDKVNSAQDMRSLCVLFSSDSEVFNLGATPSSLVNTGTGNSFNFAHAANGSGSATESGREHYIGQTGFYVTGLRAHLSAAPGSGKSVSFVLRKNGADVLTLVVSDSNTVGSTAGEVSFVTGDRISFNQYAGGAPLTTVAPIKWALTGEFITPAEPPPPSIPNGGECCTADPTHSEPVPGDPPETSRFYPLPEFVSSCPGPGLVPEGGQGNISADDWGY